MICERCEVKQAEYVININKIGGGDSLFEYDLETCESCTKEISEAIDHSGYM